LGIFQFVAKKKGDNKSDLKAVYKRTTFDTKEVESEDYDDTMNSEEEQEY